MSAPKVEVLVFLAFALSVKIYTSHARSAWLWASRCPFFTRELADYPNQRIVGMIVSGVIYQADVELQGVFVPHLTSLPKGFGAVSKAASAPAG